LAFAVAERRHELGIRLAIGAPPSRLVAELLGRAWALAAGGIAAGAAASLAIMRAIGSLVKGVPSFDITVYLAVGFGRRRRKGRAGIASHPAGGALLRRPVGPEDRLRAAPTPPLMPR
jgi:ABC-type lipoprotein release transport system permease subunit